LIDFYALGLYLRNWIQIITCFFRTRLISNFAKDMEILALRSQLYITQQQIVNEKISKPRFTPAFRQLWRFLSRLLPDWQSSEVIQVFLDTEISKVRQTKNFSRNNSPDQKNSSGKSFAFS